RSKRDWSSDVCSSDLHHDVINHHAHQVLTDGVVHIHGLGNGNFGSHPIGGGSEHGTTVAGQRRSSPQARKTTEAAEHTAAVRCGDRGRHQGHGLVPGLHSDAG